MSTINIYCNNECPANDVSADVNGWWGELDQVVKNDFLSCIDELRNGDQITLAGHVCTKDGNSLRVEEH